MINDIEKIENLIKGFPTIIMYRINYLGKRGYVLQEPFKPYSGLTGALTSATFKGNIGAKRLETWRDTQRADLGAENADAFLEQMASFGNLLHQCLVRIKNDGYLDFDFERDYASAFFEKSALDNNIKPNANVIRKQVFEYSKSAASLLQFFYECVTEVHAIEGMCKSDELSIATPIDIVCTLKDKKGDFKATLNLKTSSQIGDHQLEQAVVEKHLWNTTYPEMQVTKTGILRPKAWSLKKMIPTYELALVEEKEEERILTSALRRLAICLNDEESTYYNFPASVNVFTGKIKAGEPPIITSKTLESLFTESLTREI